jgi:hypothetical protein
MLMFQRHHRNMLGRTAMSRILSLLVLLATLATLGTRTFGADARWGERAAWLGLLGVTLVLLAIRTALLARAALRGELPWPRLMLPLIFLLEGTGMWWGDGAPVWQLVRMASAILLELAFIVLAIHQLRRASDGDELPEARLTESLGQLLPPRAARLIAFELVIMGSALRFVSGGWRRPERQGFTYHRESSLRMLLRMLPLIAIADVALLELVLLPRAALWLRIAIHVLAIYGVIWLIGLYASLRARPHRIHDGQATLHRGVLGHIEVALDQIASIGVLPTFGDDWKLRAYRKGATRIDVSGPTILDIRLHAPIRPIGVLGRGRASDRLLVAVDDPASFVAALGRCVAGP